jgi:hypothetical protein
MFHSQTMAPYFVLPRKHDKFEFKTTVERNGIVLARPCAKIVKKSRNSVDKTMQSKVISATRGRREQYEDEHTEDTERYTDYPPLYAEYINYRSLKNAYSYGDAVADKYFNISFADFCALRNCVQKQTYFPPKIQPDKDVEVVHWPKVVHSPKRKLTYAQMAM